MKHKDYWRNSILMEAPSKVTVTKPNSRENSDEHYIIGLCDEVLGEKASRQHCFDFLRGDACENFPLGKKLPVDAYYDSLNLVVEYYERQHTESVEHFNKKQTVSGVTRDEQRRIYDERRKRVLPEHGIDLVVLSYTDFKHDNRKRLVRDKKADLETIEQKLTQYIDAPAEVHED
jgi:hypothetical protein